MCATKFHIDLFSNKLNFICPKNIQAEIRVAWNSWLFKDYRWHRIARKCHLQGCCCSDIKWSLSTHIASKITAQNPNLYMHSHDCCVCKCVNWQCQQLKVHNLEFFKIQNRWNKIVWTNIAMGTGTKNGFLLWKKLPAKNRCISTFCW